MGQYDGEIRAGRATGAEKLPGGFAVTLEDGSRTTARRMVVTTGLVDELPELEGLRERWDNAVVGLRLEDDRLVPAAAITVATYMRARGAVLDSLGIETVPHPSGLGEHVVVDEMRQASVPGVYAAGNVTDVSAQPMGAAAAGTMAGVFANMDLVMSDTRERMNT